MGANISVAIDSDSSIATIIGKTELHGSDVHAVDLRAGASLIFAGLLAEGKTKIYEPYHVLRGYDRIIDKLKNIGADIKLVREEENE
jgi:UDP-N-acetylglucosamine 1-carboxyvinyltransferase